MTLFDAGPPAVPTGPTGATPLTPIEMDLPCRLTGCTRPLEAHIVTIAAVENARHPRRKPATKKGEPA